MNNFLRYWLPLAAHMGLIFYLSSRTGFPIEAPKWFYFADKFVHAGLFGALCFLFLRAWLQGRWYQANTRVFLLAIGFTTLYGISDEFHQIYVPGRHPSFGDIVADCIGAILVCVSFFWLKHFGWSEVTDETKL